jgi:hypothetical protein
MVKLLAKLPDHNDVGPYGEMMVANPGKKKFFIAEVEVQKVVHNYENDTDEPYLKMNRAAIISKGDEDVAELLLRNAHRAIYGDDLFANLAVVNTATGELIETEGKRER